VRPRRVELRCAG